MGALPEEESRQALLTRRTDDEVRVRLALGVEVLGDVLDVQHVGQVLDRGALGRLVVQQRAHRVGDLAPAAVADRDVHVQAGHVRGAGGRVLERPRGVRGQQVQRTDRVHAPAAGVRDVVDQPLDDREQRRQLGRRPVEVVGGQQPQRDDLDTDLVAPAEDLLDLVGAGPPAARLRSAGRLRPPAVAVEDDPDVARDLLGVQRSRDASRVEAVQQVSHGRPA
jgi:hypothetical protein